MALLRSLQREAVGTVGLGRLSASRQEPRSACRVADADVERALTEGFGSLRPFNIATRSYAGLAFYAYKQKNDGDKSASQHPENTQSATKKGWRPWSGSLPFASLRLAMTERAIYPARAGRLR